MLKKNNNSVFDTYLHSPHSSWQAYYFDRDDQALNNFAKFFRHQSHEEREHAEKLMKIQNQRGGRIFLQDVRVWTHVFLKFTIFLLSIYVIPNVSNNVQYHFSLEL